MSEFPSKSVFSNNNVLNQESRSKFASIFQTRAFGKEISNMNNAAQQKTKFNQENKYSVNQETILPFDKFLKDTKGSKLILKKPTTINITSNFEDETMEIEDYRRNNPQEISMYAYEIFDYLRSTETKCLPDSKYMSNLQKDVNEKMRGILLDWLVDVHMKFKLVPETLFLTVNIIDRYLERTLIPRQKLQLVGITSMLIACKYEEIYVPEINDFVYVTDKAYNTQEVLEMEGNILSALQFNLTFTSSLRFLERYSHLNNYDQKSFLMARYLIEMCLIEYKMLSYNPSLIACSAIYLVNKFKKKCPWIPCVAKNTKYEEKDLGNCSRDIYLLLQNADKSNLQAIRRKFAGEKYQEVSKIFAERK